MIYNIELGKGVGPGPTKKGWDWSKKGFRGVHISCRGADAFVSLGVY